MSDILVQIIFGWPAIITSLVLSVAGLVLRKPWLLVIAGVLAIPFSWYLSGYPAIRTPAALLPLFQFGAAWALQREKKALAWILLAPLATITVVLAVVVLRQ
jgi:hypothetical protein